MPLIDALMTDERTSVIVATGGVPVVRAAYSWGTPRSAWGRQRTGAGGRHRRPGQRGPPIVDSKSLDNSVLCTNESMLIVEEQAANMPLRQLKSHGACVLEPVLPRDKVS